MRVTVRLFAGLRERAGSGRDTTSSFATEPRVEDVWPALELGEEPAGPRLRGQPRATSSATRLSRTATRSRSSLRSPAATSVSRTTRSSSPRSWPRSKTSAPAPSPRSSAPSAPVARPEGRPPRVRGLRGHGRERHGRPGRAADGALRPLRRRDHAPRGRLRDRRGERGDRRLRAAPPGRARRLQGRDRHAQGDGAACGRRRSTRAARSGSAGAPS